MKIDKKEQRELNILLIKRMEEVLLGVDVKATEQIKKYLSNAADKIAGKFIKASAKISKKEAKQTKRQKAGKISKKASKKIAVAKLKDNLIRTKIAADVQAKA